MQRQWSAQQQWRHSSSTPHRHHYATTAITNTDTAHATTTTTIITTSPCLLLLLSVCRYMKGNDVTHLASMCKLKGGRLAREVTDSCLQYYGACLPAGVYKANAVVVLLL